GQLQTPPLKTDSLHKFLDKVSAALTTLGPICNHPFSQLLCFPHIEHQLIARCAGRFFLAQQPITLICYEAEYEILYPWGFAEETCAKRLHNIVFEMNAPKKPLFIESKFDLKQLICRYLDDNEPRLWNTIELAKCLPNYYDMLDPQADAEFFIEVYRLILTSRKECDDEGTRVKASNILEALPTVAKFLPNYLVGNKSKRMLARTKSTEIPEEKRQFYGTEESVLTAYDGLQRSLMNIPSRIG
ncbi:hypothetical protein DFQ30_004594, partial [Apophysomyces sp. BC1015]